MATREEIMALCGVGTQIADYCAEYNLAPQLLAETGVADNRIALYRIDYTLVIDTNGDAVWRHRDPDGFALLLKELLK